MLAFKIAGLSGGISTAILLEQVLSTDTGITILVAQVVALIAVTYGMYTHRDDPNYAHRFFL